MGHAVARKKYLVDVRVQGPFLARVGAIWAGGILLLCVVLYYLADEELGRSFFSIHTRIRNTWQILLPAVALSGAVAFLVTIAVTIRFALRESNRVGGPVYKFGLLFRSLEEGEVDPGFRFRKGDLLYDLGERYREALLSAGRRIADVQDGIDRAAAALEALRAARGSLPADPSAEAALAEAVAAVEEARRRAGSFRVRR